MNWIHRQQTTYIISTAPIFFVSTVNFGKMYADLVIELTPLTPQEFSSKFLSLQQDVGQMAPQNTAVQRSLHWALNFLPWSRFFGNVLTGEKCGDRSVKLRNLLILAVDIQQCRGNSPKKLGDGCILVIPCWGEAANKKCFIWRDMINAIAQLFNCSSRREIEISW